MKLRPLFAGATTCALALGFWESPAGADQGGGHTRTVTVAGHTCELTFALEVTRGSGSFENPDRVAAATSSYSPENIFDLYCAQGVEVVARVEYDSAGVRSNYVNRRTGPDNPESPDATTVGVTGESRFDQSVGADDGLHNGVASYKVIFPNGVYFADTIGFASRK